MEVYKSSDVTIVFIDTQLQYENYATPQKIFLVKRI